MSPDIQPDILPLDYPAAAIALGPLCQCHVNLSEGNVQCCEAFSPYLRKQESAC